MNVNRVIVSFHVFKTKPDYVVEMFQHKNVFFTFHRYISGIKLLHRKCKTESYLPINNKILFVGALHTIFFILFFTV